MKIGSISGSLTRKINGDSYIIAGSGITVVSGSDGSITISSTAGGSLGYFEPLAKPIAPNAFDDEFDGASSFTLWDPGSVGTLDVTNDSQLEFIVPSAVPYNASGAYKQLPAGNWTVWAKFTMVQGANVQCGMGISAVLPDSVSAFDIIKVARSPTSGVSVDRWANYQTYTSFLASPVNSEAATNENWFRIRYDSGTNNVYWDWCNDGMSWRQLFSGTPLAVPNYLLLYVLNQGSGAAPNIVRIEFVRLVSSIAQNDLMLGRVI